MTGSFQSLCHSNWDCKHHAVIFTKPPPLAEVSDSEHHFNSIAETNTIINL